MPFQFESASLPDLSSHSYLAAGNVDLYGKLGYIQPDKEAGDRQIYHRHWIEVGAARGADVFTTVRYLPPLCS